MILNSIQFCAGLKPAKIECIRELEVINALDDTKLLFIHQHHAMRVERYEMKVYTFSPNESSPESGPCLLRMVLERSHPLHTVVKENIISFNIF